MTMTMTIITTKTSEDDHSNRDGGEDVCGSVDVTVPVFQFPQPFLIPPTAPHPLIILLSDAIYSFDTDSVFK
jgi:hypothetical protein